MISAGFLIHTPIHNNTVSRRLDCIIAFDVLVLFVLLYISLSLFFIFILVPQSAPGPRPKPRYFDLSQRAGLDIREICAEADRLGYVPTSEGELRAAVRVDSRRPPSQMKRSTAFWLMVTRKSLDCPKRFEELAGRYGLGIDGGIVYHYWLRRPGSYCYYSGDEFDHAAECVLIREKLPVPSFI